MNQFLGHHSRVEQVFHIFLSSDIVNFEHRVVLSQSVLELVGVLRHEHLRPQDYEDWSVHLTRLKLSFELFDVGVEEELDVVASFE